MKEKRVFISEDGQAFSSESACLFWEQIVKRLESINDNYKHYPLAEIPYTTDEGLLNENGEWDHEIPERVYYFFKRTYEIGLRGMFSLDMELPENADRSLNWKAVRMVEFLRGWKAVSDWVWEGLEWESDLDENPRSCDAEN